MNKVFLLVFVGLCLASCKKEKQYSTWNINGQGFSTNEVIEDEGSARTDIYSINKEDGFNLVSIGLPGGMSKPISCSTPDPSDICLVFYYKGNTYRVKPLITPAKISISEPNKNHKKSLSLSQTWFRNNLQPDDSLLISAVINEP